MLDLDGGATVSLVVDTSCTYFAPISYPDIVHCGLRVVHLGSSSVRYEIGVFREHDPLAAARGQYVHVCCDRITMKPVPDAGLVEGGACETDAACERVRTTSDASPEWT